MNLPQSLLPTEKMEVDLPNGITVLLPLCRPVFSQWTGDAINFDYGKKPVLNYKGEPCFAELLILRMLLAEGWEGVWIEAYGGTHFLKTMPKAWNLKSEHVSIPEDKEALLKRIWKTGNTKACFDVFVWHEGQYLFLEAKRDGKDKLTSAQAKFIEGALACGVLPEHMIIIEWKTETAAEKLSDENISELVGFFDELHKFDREDKEKNEEEKE